MGNKGGRQNGYKQKHFTSTLLPEFKNAVQQTIPGRNVSLSYLQHQIWHLRHANKLKRKAKTLECNSTASVKQHAQGEEQPIPFALP